MNISQLLFGRLTGRGHPIIKSTPVVRSLWGLPLNTFTAESQGSLVQSRLGGGTLCVTFADQGRITHSIITGCLNDAQGLPCSPRGAVATLAGRSSWAKFSGLAALAGDDGLGCA